MPKKKRSESPTNVFNGILYLDSFAKVIDMVDVPEDWNAFQKSGMKTEVDTRLSMMDMRFMYVLHDEDGNKPHIHWVMGSDKKQLLKTTRNQMSGQFGESVPRNLIQITEDVSNITDYLTHNSFTSREAGKHVYPADRIVNIHEFDWHNYVEYNTIQRKTGYRQAYELIRAHDFTNTKQLRDYVYYHQGEEGVPEYGLFVDLTRVYGSQLKNACTGNYSDREAPEVKEQREVAKRALEMNASTDEKLATLIEWMLKNN